MTFEKQLEDPNSIKTSTLSQDLESPPQSVKDLISTKYPRAFAFKRFQSEIENSTLGQGEKNKEKILDQKLPFHAANDGQSLT